MDTLVITLLSVKQMEGVIHVIAGYLGSIFTDTENTGIFSFQQKAENMLYQKSEYCSDS